MQSNQPRKGQRPKFIEAKYLITALALAITVGFWDIFSIESYVSEESSPSAEITLPPQTPSTAADNLPPLPTLFPLVDVTNSQLTDTSGGKNTLPVENLLPAQPQPTTQLRVVGVPTQTIVQKQKPLFGDQMVSSQNSDNGSGSNSSKGKKSKSTSKSSRK